MMTDEEILKVVSAHKEGKKIQFRDHKRMMEWNDVVGHSPAWNFENLEYRVAPELPKPREWIINVQGGGSFPDSEYKILGGCEYGRTCGIPGNVEQVHVREVLE